MTTPQAPSNSGVQPFKEALTSLATRGNDLLNALQADCRPKEFEEAVRKQLGTKTKAYIKKLPSFANTYQSWYSEAKALVRQVLPDRLEDFVRHYEKPKPRREITFENYRIEDCLQGLRVTRGWQKEVVVDSSAAIPHLVQQLAIVTAAKERFERALYDIRQIVMADLFDSELDAAAALIKSKFYRAAGAVAGVVLEKHLIEVCATRQIKVASSKPTISVLNETLKKADVIDVPQWRFIQHLGDIRNICDHAKSAEPTADQIEDLLSGVKKVLKTIY